MLYLLDQKKQKQRRDFYLKNLENGEIQLLVGTHALT